MLLLNKVDISVTLMNAFLSSVYLRWVVFLSATEGKKREGEVSRSSF